MRQLPRLLALALPLGAAACAAVPPSGPTLLALPSQGKDFQSFQREDAFCQQTAAQQSNLAAAPQVAGNSTVGGAGVGALGGAAVGALLGAATGNAGAGAAIGAGTGLVGGGLLGASSGQAGSGELQRRFDAVYAQCMTAYGNQIQGGLRPFAALAPTPVYPAPFYAAPPPVSFSFGYSTGPRWGRPWGYGPGWGYRRGWW